MIKQPGLTTTEFNYVLPTTVRSFLTEQFSNPLIKRSVYQPGSILFNIVAKLEARPLFYYNGNKEARLIFSSWYGVLDLRNTTYDNALFRDLYLLHELNHMATLQYAQMSDAEWTEAHIRNEKASSFWSEALVYFEYPAIFSEANKIFPLWVEQYFNDTTQLVPGTSNHVIYAQSPEFFSALLFQEFVKISNKEYSQLTDIELRTRKYDFKTENWCDLNRVLQQTVNLHTLDYRRLLDTGRQDLAIEFHKSWLKNNLSERGVLFDKSHPLLSSLNSKQHYAAANAEPRAETLTLKYQIPYKLSLQGYLDRIITVMQTEEAAGNITQTPLFAPTKQLIRDVGITSTIYSLFTRPARNVTTALQANTSMQDKLYGMAQSRKQDGLNQQFTDQYKHWTNGLVVGLDDFTYAYPTSGSSEALRESIIELNANARANGQNIKTHIFQGEYEGVKSYTAAANLRLIEHPTRDISILNKSSELQAGDLFYISHPSSIDGNVWADLNQFLDLMHEKKIRVLIDLTYVGAYSASQQIIANHKAIECVYFSLSKSFGVYYHRVGGVFSRTPIQLLTGNKWFKNAFSMSLGISLMQKFDYNAIPDFYKKIQVALTAYVNAKLDLNLQASDVFLIAQQSIDKSQFTKLPESLKILCRPVSNANHYVLRVCLQPLFDYLTNDFHDTFTVFNFELAKHITANTLAPKAKSCSVDTPAISAEEIEQLRTANWKVTDKLSKTFALSNNQLWQFAEDVLLAANKLNHHPTLIVTNGKCIIELITHANNIITNVDTKLAKEIDKIYAHYNSKQQQSLIFSQPNAATEDTSVNSEAKFAFKTFTQAFDFGRKAAAHIPAHIKNYIITINWGECTITAPQQFIPKIKDIYQAANIKRPSIKHRAKL